MAVTTTFSSNACKRSPLKTLNLENEQYISTDEESSSELVVPKLHKEEITRSIELLSPKPKDRATKRKVVTFSNIQIRYYSQTVGDHPCTTRGPPISLDWQYNVGASIPVDEYESKMTRTRNSRKKKTKSLILSDSQRRIILMNRYGYDLEDIRTAIKERIKTARQREKSAKLTPSMKVGKVLKNARLNTLKILQVRQFAPSA